MKQESRNQREEYERKLLEHGYSVGEEENMLTVYVEEITEKIVKTINQEMKGYGRSYGIVPECRRTGTLLSI